MNYSIVHYIYFVIDNKIHLLWIRYAKFIRTGSHTLYISNRFHVFIFRRRFVNSSPSPLSSILPTSPTRLSLMSNFADASISTTHRTSNHLTAQPNGIHYSNDRSSSTMSSSSSGANSLYDAYLMRQHHQQQPSYHHQQQSTSVVNRARHLRTVSLPFYDLLHVITEPTELGKPVFSLFSVSCSYDVSIDSLFDD